MTPEELFASPIDVRLRDVQPTDLPTLYQHQRDPDAIRMAAVHPRDAQAFTTHWSKILNDATIVAQAILVDEILVGYVTCFPHEDVHYVGYWIDKEYWGRGIATRALARLLERVPIRPLQARVAQENIGSLRVLERCGFVITGYYYTPASERYPECIEAHLILV